MASKCIYPQDDKRTFIDIPQRRKQEKENGRGEREGLVK